LICFACERSPPPRDNTSPTRIPLLGCTSMPWTPLYLQNWITILPFGVGCGAPDLPGCYQQFRLIVPEFFAKPCFPTTFCLFPIPKLTFVHLSIYGTSHGADGRSDRCTRFFLPRPCADQTLGNSVYHLLRIFRPRFTLGPWSIASPLEDIFSFCPPRMARALLRPFSLMY